MDSMSPEERIVALERELNDTRLAAMRLMLSIAGSFNQTPEQRQDLGMRLAAHASGNPVAEKLVWPVAEALHRGMVKKAGAARTGQAEDNG